MTNAIHPETGKVRDDYVLGRSEAETRRLILQSRLYGSSTRGLLTEAGLSEGMNVLDVGSGAGDVALLAAELVGREGSVVGVDRNPTVLGLARARASDAGLTNVTFLDGDVFDLASAREDFDAVVGRFVLMYQPDPVWGLGDLAGRLRRGGVVAFQEINLHPESLRLYPPTPLWQRYWGWSQALQQRGGPETEMGYKLHHTFLAAGLPAPAMRLDALIGGGPEWGGYEYAAETLRSLLPMMLKLGIASEVEVGIDTLAERLRRETVAADGIVKMPEVVGAWARIP